MRTTYEIFHYVAGDALFNIKFDSFGNVLVREIGPFSGTGGELPVPTKKNHEFLGWFDDDGNAYTADTIYNVDGQMIEPIQKGDRYYVQVSYTNHYGCQGLR